MKQSENPTTATSRETERILKLKQTFTHSNNWNKVQLYDFPVPSLPVLPTDLPLPLSLPLPSWFYPLPFVHAAPSGVVFIST